MSSWDFGDGQSSPPQQAPGWDSAPPAPAPPTERFGETRPAPSSPTSGGGASAPLHWLGLAAVVALAAVAIDVLTDSTAMAVVGWALGGPVAIALLAVFLSHDLTRRADPWYAESGITAWARRLVVVLSLVAVGLSAWTIADHLSRRGS